jgi:hypothetical protein
VLCLIVENGQIVNQLAIFEVNFVGLSCLGCNCTWLNRLAYYSFIHDKFGILYMVWDLKIFLSNNFT